MMTRMFRLAVVLVAVSSVPFSASAAEEPKLSGAILKLSEITDKRFTVNVGGLIIAIVRDSGSRPPQNIKVDAPCEYQGLGRRARNAERTRTAAYGWWLHLASVHACVGGRHDGQSQLHGERRRWQESGARVQSESRKTRLGSAMKIARWIFWIAGVYGLTGRRSISCSTNGPR